MRDAAAANFDPPLHKGPFAMKTKTPAREANREMDFEFTSHAGGDLPRRVGLPTEDGSLRTLAITS